jgi:hypothetical protein
MKFKDLLWKQEDRNWPEMERWPMKEQQWLNGCLYIIPASNNIRKIMFKQ